MFGSSFGREARFTEDEWVARSARPATFIATRGGIDVGVAGAYEFDAGWCVMGMWVAPAARGTGIVDELVDACAKQVRSAGGDVVHLWVIDSNTRGVRAYRRLGFNPSGLTERLSDGRVEISMSRTLSSD